MDDVDVSSIIVVMVVLALAIFGLITLTMDFRYFGDVQKQCAELGYIQNKTVRIYCGEKQRPTITP